MNCKTRFGSPSICLLCGEIFVPKKIDNRPDKFTGQMWLCGNCLNTRTDAALVKLKHHIRLSRSKGHDATLTLRQWHLTLNDFEWRCAYCLEKQYYALEHFVSAARGGGTTSYNCVPACAKCNVRKDSWGLPEAYVERVKQYLSNKVLIPVVDYFGLPLEADLVHNWATQY